jgi:hypothetical protein
MKNFKEWLQVQEEGILGPIALAAGQMLGQTDHPQDDAQKYEDESEKINSRLQQFRQESNNFDSFKQKLQFYSNKLDKQLANVPERFTDGDKINSILDENEKLISTCLKDISKINIDDITSRDKDIQSFFSSLLKISKQFIKQSIEKHLPKDSIYEDLVKDTENKATEIAEEILKKNIKYIASKMVTRHKEILGDKTQEDPKLLEKFAIILLNNFKTTKDKS